LEGEDALFFGRDKDARLLVNKILSARLTLVYGASGVGKSSLLRALVARDLRDEEIGDTEVVFFDRWAEPDVEVAIKQEIASAIEPDAAGLSPRELLTAWAGLVNRVRQKPLVLILDQFEQFCRIRAGKPDLLSKELAALVRAEMPAHLVLSLREEFLAGLEIFSDDIVTIYDSMFRLEHLSDQGARDAIVRPAEKFGVLVQPDLVKTLIRDLKKRDEALVLSVGPTAPGVELPFLQIICERLWKELQESPDSNASNQLPLSLYDRLDRREGIIRRYVEGLASELSPRLQEDAAAILKRLAPRSGIKASCTPIQLSEDTGLPVDRVERILQPFADHYVLRPRLIGSTKWYELYHDAYIQVLTGWIDGKLAGKRERERFWHLTRWGLAISFVVAIVGLLSYSVYRVKYQSEAEAYRIIEGDIEQAIKDEGDLAQEKDAQTKQRRHVEAAFLQSAKHTWNEVKDIGNQGVVDAQVNDLKSRFAKPTIYKVFTADGSRPASRDDYINEPACTEDWARGTEPKSGKTSVTLAFGPDLDLDESTLRCAWMQVVSGLRRSHPAILLPSRLNTEVSSQAANNAITLYIAKVPINVDLALRHQEAGNYHDVGVKTEDLMRHHSLWNFFNGQNALDWPYFIGNYASLPHWTLPLLRVADIDRFPVEFLVIEKAILNLLQDQRPTLTRQVVDYLIDRARKDAPQTVAEAVRARGSPEGVREVLLEMIGQDKKIAENFSTLLDAMAQFPADLQQSPNVTSGISRSPVTVAVPPQSAPPKGFSAATAAQGILAELKSLAITDGAELHLRVKSHRPKANSPRRGMRGQRKAPTTTLEDARDHGPDQFGGGPAVSSATAFGPDNYDIAPEDIPEESPPLHAYLGADLWSCFVEASGNPREGILDKFTKMHAAFSARVGVPVPGIQLDPAAGSYDIDRSAFVVKVADEKANERYFGPVTVRGDCVDETLRELETRWELARAMFLASDDIEQALGKLGSNQSRWLRDNYSLTDLKLLLRAVLAPNREEIKNVQMPSTNDGRTLRALPDLLSSLVFWTQYCTIEGKTELDGECLVRNLRETQRLRFFVTGSLRFGPNAAARLVATGLDDLLKRGAENPDAAEASFIKAVAMSKPATGEAKTAFLSLFKSRTLTAWAERLEGSLSCGQPTPGSVTNRVDLTADDRTELDQFFDAATRADPANAWLGLRLCRVQSSDLKIGRDKVIKDLDLLLYNAAAGNVTTAEAEAIGVLELKARQKDFWRPDLALDAAKQLVTRAFHEWGRRGDTEDAEAAFTELGGICLGDETRGSRWCRSVMEAAWTAYGRANASMSLDLGLSMIGGGNQIDLRHALALLNTGVRQLKKESDNGAKLAASFQYARALADVALAQYGDRTLLTEAANLLPALEGVTSAESGWPTPSEVASLRVQVALLAGDAAAADKILAASQSEDNRALQTCRMYLLLERDDLPAALSMIKQSEKKLDEKDSLYLLGFLQYLDNATTELETTVRRLAELQHPFADYMRLLLFVSAEGQGKGEAAREALDKRWKEIASNAETWSYRLRQGDETAWQEMLVGYFLDKVPSEQIFTWLADPEKFVASPLSATSVPWSSYLTDYFYEAQRQSITGDRQTRLERQIESLHHAVARGPVIDNEYFLARYQLRVLETGQ
jgi:hypothetical protein